MRQLLIILVTAFSALDPTAAAAEQASYRAVAAPGYGMGHGALADNAPRPTAARLVFDGELGFLAPLSHVIQFSKDGTEIDYIKDAGQDVLFPFLRLQAQLRIAQRHGITLLYQPLELNSEELAPRDLVVDGEVFEAGTPMRYTYGFPFWRLAYTYYVSSIDAHEAGWDVGVGASLQVRNATIEFASLDGQQLRTNRDVGPVPLLRAVARHVAPSRVFFEAEVDGFYAPIRYINGGSSDVEGAIVDLNVRSGLMLSPDLETYLNLRYLAGGAQGTSSSDDGPGDGFTRNWLHFLTFSLGARFRAL